MNTKVPERTWDLGAVDGTGRVATSREGIRLRSATRAHSPVNVLEPDACIFPGDQE
jgi:hypothetical protein